MAHLTKAQILASLDLPREVVDVPEWGGTVLVQGLRGSARDAYETSLVDLEASEPGHIVTTVDNRRAKLVARGIIAEDGTQLFTEDDITALGEKSAIALERISAVIERLSGMNSAAEKAASKN